ncbi:MAG: DUF222 domain-containing protein [Nocardioides sp.]
MINRTDIDSLDRHSVLDAAVESRRGADRCEADLLAVAAYFADLHPVPNGGVRSGHGDPTLRVADPTSPTGADLGRERYAPLAGTGTPGVAEFAPEQLAAALGVSGDAAKNLIGDSLELRHRLPRLWALVFDGHLRAWKARTVATDTTTLSREAVDFVDRHIAVVAVRNRVPGPGQLNRLIHEALLRCDPDVAEAREQAALDKRGVWSSHRESTATTTMTIIADTPDALAFDHSIGQVAVTLGALGDPDTLDVRRARAIGILADPQKSLNLLGSTLDPARNGNTGDATGNTGNSGSTGSTGTTRKTPGGLGKIGAILHLHLHADATGTIETIGTVETEERYGALTRDLIKSWLERADHITIRPVLHSHGCDMSTGSTSSLEAAAGYTVPPVMAQQVRLRDHTCVFPDCTRPARTCDLDHITAYNPDTDAHPDPDSTDPNPAVPAEPAGTVDPVTGRTHPENLAPLCRRHHRIKTHGRWRCRRKPDGSYTWTSPTGRTYTVDPSHYGGTRHPDQPPPALTLRPGEPRQPDTPAA